MGEANTSSRGIDDFGQVAQRLLGVHIFAIMVLAFLGASAGYLLQRGHTVMYTATARVILDTSVPQTAGESQAIADTVQAVVTAPGHVAHALATVGVAGDAVAIAKHDVSVQSIGTSSGVLGLSVKHHSPTVAAALANTLANDLIVTRQQARDAELTSLATVLKTSLLALPAGIDQSNALAQSLVQLHTNSVLQSQPSVVDPAAAPAHPDPSGLLPDVGLGLVLGLGLGMAWAAFAESFHPTLMGARAIADALGTPLIGRVSRRNRGAAHLDKLAERTWLRIASTDTTRLRVASTGTSTQALAEQLTTRLSTVPVEGREHLGDVQITSRLSLSTQRPMLRHEAFTPPVVALAAAAGNGNATTNGAGNGSGNGNGKASTRLNRVSASWRSDSYSSPIMGHEVESDTAVVTADRGRHSLAAGREPRIEGGQGPEGPTPEQEPSWGVLVVTPRRLKRTALAPIYDDIAITGEQVLGVIVANPERGAARRRA